MLVKLVWPDCTYQHRQWGQRPQDAFWVQCDEDEAAIVASSITDGFMRARLVLLTLTSDRTAASSSLAIWTRWSRCHGSIPTAACGTATARSGGFRSRSTISSLAQVSAIELPGELRGSP